MAPSWVRQIVSMSVLLLPFFAGSAAAQERSKEQAKETPSPPSPNETTALPEMIVTEQPEHSYAVKQAATVTKTDPPIMEAPVSIQVVPQQVLKDQQTTRLNQAVKNVSGVYSSSLFQGQSGDEFVNGI